MTQAGYRTDWRDVVDPALLEAAETHAHLWYYMEDLDIDTIGVPVFYPEVGRKTPNAAKKNLIYTVPGGIFVHILSDEEDARDSYIAIDPSYVDDLMPLLVKLEPYLLDYVDELEACETEAEKTEVLLAAVDENVTVSSKGKKGGGGLLPFGRKKKDDDESTEIVVTPEQVEGLKYLVVRDKIGMGVLEPLIRDPNIEDISCSGLGQLFIEHKIFKALKASIRFDEMQELDQFVLRLSEKIKKPVTFRNPISDATLPDGSRINIVYGGDVSTRGSNFTIRKFTAVPLSILDIIDSGGISFEMAAYLSLMVQEGMNIFVSGETASGKTTLLNALTCFYEPAAKIVTIEDTPELQVPHPNWTREVVRGSMSGDSSSVTMFALLKAALRQRPNAIMIGEIRGEEGAIAFQAMQTGHAVAATFHASTVEKLIQRLTGNPINVPKAYVDNLNVVCIASAVRLPNGKPGRRILSVNEIIAYDSASDSFSFIETYRWNAHNDTFEATGNMNSYLLENKIAPKRGIDPQNKRLIYDEVNKRARLFERLLKAGRTNFLISTRLFRRLSGKASSEAPPRKWEKDAKDDAFGPTSLFSREPLDYDLITQLTHMSAVATSGISRDRLFGGTASLDYSTSKYFRRVHRVAQRLNYDYSQACEVVGDQVKNDSVQNLLLHFATALSAGEAETEFLQRETEVQLELYGKKYERDMESLRKWTDAYVALMVSTTLIIVISLVSMMIYPMSPIALYGMGFLVMMVTAAGGWIIFTVAPHEVKSHRLRRRSAEQARMENLGVIIVSLVGPVIVALWIFVSLAVGFIVASLMLTPMAYLAWIDDKKITKRDEDLAAFLRALGSVMGAVGTTVTEGLSRLNRRSLGAMEPHVRRLYVRLKNDISPELTWARLAGETGSELVTRCVRIFAEGIRLGGDPALVGGLAAAFAQKVSLMRSSRALVANTFVFVVVPMHAALLGILLFVTEVVRVFGGKISEVQGQTMDNKLVAEAGVSNAILYSSPDMQMITILLMSTIVMLTIANAFAPYAASGGHRFKLFIYASLMMGISGVTMLIVPFVVDSLFKSLAETPVTSGVPAGFIHFLL